MTPARQAPDTDLAARLRLARTPHVGPRSYRELIARFGPRGVWLAEESVGSPPAKLPLGRGYQSEPLVVRALFARHWGPTFDLLRLDRDQ